MLLNKCIYYMFMHIFYSNMLQAKKKKKIYITKKYIASKDFFVKYKNMQPSFFTLIKIWRTKLYERSNLH